MARAGHESDVIPRRAHHLTQGHIVGVNQGHAAAGRTSRPCRARGTGLALNTLGTRRTHIARSSCGAGDTLDALYTLQALRTLRTYGTGIARGAGGTRGARRTCWACRACLTSSARLTRGSRHARGARRPRYACRSSNTCRARGSRRPCACRTHGTDSPCGASGSCCPRRTRGSCANAWSAMHQLSRHAIDTQQLAASGCIGRQSRNHDFTCVLYTQTLGPCRIFDNEISAWRHGDADISSVRDRREEASAQAQSKNQARRYVDFFTGHSSAAVEIKHLGTLRQTYEPRMKRENEQLRVLYGYDVGEPGPDHQASSSSTSAHRY